tara:strand:- start:361 stop:2040 length:1680 start_codon:yes stop_codon:yes gene_type:complete
MISNTQLRTGGQILIDQLIRNNTELAFCVPGESYLDALDAMHDKKEILKLINARHEAGAANMAEAYGKLSGKPGIAFVTRGPGACHASIGVHIAFQDSTPMILFIGQVSRQAEGREAFQEIDYKQMFNPIAKWVTQIDNAERIPETVSRAFRTALSGRPGPVVVALPEDMLKDKTNAQLVPNFTKEKSDVRTASVEKLKELFSKSKRPLLLLGGGSWSDKSVNSICKFAKNNNLPIATTFRRLDCVTLKNENFVGDFGTSGPTSLIDNMKDVDTLLVVGARLGEMTTQGYEMLKPPTLSQNLIHVHISSEELGKVYTPILGITASPEEFTEKIENEVISNCSNFIGWLGKLRKEYKKDKQPKPYKSKLDLGKAFLDLRNIVPKDCIYTLDAGNHSGWPQRFLNFGRPSRLIGSTCGSMGYGIPAAVTASILFPERLVIGFVGDGGFLMSGLELGTAMQYNAKPIIIIFNNENYGTIRMHQEREYPGRVYGTNLKNPDFCALGASFGAFTQHVNDTKDFIPAVKKAIDSKKMSLIELSVEKNQLSTRLHLDDIKKKDSNG